MKKIIASVSLFLFPIVALAQQPLLFNSFDSTLGSIQAIINRVIPIVIGVAVLLFLIGLVSYVTAGGDEEKRDAARSMIIYGIIVLFVMVSVWGFVRILANTFFPGGAATDAPYYPQVTAGPRNPNGAQQPNSYYGY